MSENTRREIRRIADKDLIPRWGERRLSTIDRAEIKRWGVDFVENRGGYIANRTHEYMRLIWHWGLSQPELKIDTSPFFLPPRPFHGEISRERILRNEEIRKVFWEGLPEEPRITAAWWITPFLTGARKSEVMQMEKREVDREKEVWILPREKAKSRRTLILPLSKWALRVLDLAAPLSGDSPFFFPSPKQLKEAPKPITCTRRSGVRMQERLGVDFRVHDVRRTVATVMGELGVEPHIIDRVQNHRIPTESRVTATYQTHIAWSYLKEKRAALELWSKHLDGLLEGKGGRADETDTRGPPRTGGLDPLGRAWTGAAANS